MNKLTYSIALIALLLLMALGCQTPIDVPTPIYVTEVFILDDGREVVLTLEVTATPVVEEPTPEPTIAVPESVVSLDVATTSRIGEFDPQLPHNEITNTVIDNLYVGLTRIDPATNSVIGELAASWQTTESGRIWTFDLRTDMFWVQAQPPPGGSFALADDQRDVLVEIEQIRPIVADDVVAAVRRVCDKRVDTPSTFIYFLIEGCERINGLEEPTDEDFATLGVRAVSDSRLEVRLVEPAAYFLPMTSLLPFRPIPADRIADDELDWLDPEDLVTSGPFVFSEASDDEAEPQPLTVLQQNPFWPDALRLSSGSPNLEPIERVNILRYGSLQAAAVDYEKDTLDIVEPPSATIPELVQSPAKPPPLITRSEVFYLGFNFDSPAFSLPEIRRAFSASIDRDRLLEEVYGQEGLTMRHLSPPGALLAPPIEEVGAGYNPDFAFFQLASSGYGSCRAIGPIRYLINATDDALRHAEALIQMWVNELGCDTTQFEIEQVQFGTLLARTRADAGSERPDLFDLGWVGFFPDAHNWYADVVACDGRGNRPKRPCSEIDDMIRAAATTLNNQERADLYRSIENGLFNQSGWTPIVPLYLRGTYQLEQDWISRIGDERLAPETRIIRFGTPRFDLWEINQALKDLEQSQ